LLRDVAPQARIAYLATDLHFLRELRRYRELREPDALQRVGEWRSLELELFQRADRIQVYSSYERDLLAEVLPYKLIRRIPLHIADGAVERANAPFEDRSGLLFVAGFGHPPNVDAAVWFVREVLPLVRERLAGVEVALVGSRPPEQVRELAGDGVVVTRRISDEELGRRYGSARVVVAPLRYGAGLKGKIVEAMSFGVPVVTTPLGAEGLDDIEEYLRIASGARAFADAVVETYADRELWSRIAASSREYVMRYFSREAAVEQITSDFPL
jgi:glycosyltransferase involved in cell wall biosynthesis